MRQGSVAPYIMDERYTDKEWVYFGRDNLFLERMRSLVDNCAPLERAITTIARFVAGDGIYFTDKAGDKIEEASAAFDELMIDTTQEDFLFQTAYDIAFCGSKFWTARTDATGARAIRLDHVDVSRIRSGKLIDGAVKDYFFSSSWIRHRRNSSDDRFKPILIPAHKFGGANKSRTGIYSKTYKQGKDHYAEPAWLGAVAAAEIWCKIDAYNRTQLDTGFAPAMHVALQFAGSEAEADAMLEKIDKAYQSTAGQAVLYSIYGMSEAAPIITPLPRGNHAGELDAMRDACANVIYSATGVPHMLVEDRDGGLTSQGEAVKARIYQLQRMLAEPMQQMITKDIVRIMNSMGLKDVWEAHIEPLALQQFEQSEQIIMRSTTVNEARDQRGAEPREGEDGDKLLASVTINTGNPRPMDEGSAQPDGGRPEQKQLRKA